MVSTTDPDRTRCGCPQDMPSAAECAQCRNGGRPLPPFRPVDEDRLDGELETFQIPRGAVQVATLGTLGTRSFGVLQAPATCVCGDELEVGADVYRLTATEPWRGTQCCGGVSTRDSEEN